MKIQNLNLNSSLKNSSETSASKNNDPKIKCDNSMKEVPNSFYHPVNFGSSGRVIIFDPQEEIRKEKELRENLFNQFMVEEKDEEGNTILDKNGNPVTKLDPKIKKAMDEKTFEFTGPDGKKFEATIKDAIKAYIMREDSNEDGFPGLLHGTSTEAIDNIIKNGPDPRKTSRSAFGPGMYFAFSEATTMDYSSAKIQADIVPTTRENGEKGRFVVFNGNFYEKITNNQVNTAFKELLNLDRPEYEPGQPYYIQRAYDEIPSKLLDEYCRDIIVNELGIDAGYGASPGHHTCEVVFNPDAITNISRYGDENNSYNPYYY